MKKKNYNYKKKEKQLCARVRTHNWSVRGKPSHDLRVRNPPPHLPPTDSQLPCGSEEMYDHESPIDYGH